jgi:acyl-CoA reductase-like NAD-dependent aldehyde dehydrogenase
MARVARTARRAHPRRRRRRPDTPADLSRRGHQRPPARQATEALARARAEGLVVVGGTTDDSTGWFVDPTVLEVTDPRSPFLTEELFAPVLTAYVYEDADWTDALRLVDESVVLPDPFAA